MIKRESRREARKRRHERIREHLSGTPDRPRLCVTRSLSNISAQVIDDTAGRTLVSASTLEPEIKARVGYGGNTGAAREVGLEIARRAAALGIKQVVFDRAGNLYHGRVEALARAAREGGLEF